MVNRREFLTHSALASASLPLLGGTALAADEKKPLASELVSRFVSRSHFDLEAVKEMLAQEPALINASWDWGNGDWETGLGAAAHTGRRDIAQLILEHGARIDLFGATMLGHEKIVRATLDDFPSVHAVAGPHGIPLLSHAVVGREPAFGLVKLLIERGADVNAPSNLGVTPLMTAAMTDHVAALELLLDRGADLSSRDSESRDALAWAESRDHTRAAELLRQAAAR